MGSPDYSSTSRGASAAAVVMAGSSPLASPPIIGAGARAEICFQLAWHQAPGIEPSQF
jgi:hypothetical protein